MRNELLKSIMLIICLNLGLQASAQQSETSLKQIVRTYLDRNIKVFQANSTVEDIDKVFELFTNDFVYIHEQYGGKYTRERLYNGYVRNQKNGSYDGRVKNIEILKTIEGLNALVIESRTITQDGSDEAEMTLFEFKDGKISVIKEYWE